jgi:pimeloyl-ACP methyl ester carboxylesterase
LRITFKNKQSSVHAIRFGVGAKLLICFHGFGQDADAFTVLDPALSKRYKIVSIDLPFHGDTEWKRGEIFLKTDLKELLIQILELENKQRFSLMGYSLGGKIVLTAVTLFASAIDEIFLIAPDGVKISGWYKFAVYNRWGQRSFSRFVKKPELLFSVARILNRFKLVGDSSFKFLQVQTDTETKRQKVYDVWLTLRDFQFSLHEVKESLNQYEIKSFLFIGKYDRLITTTMAKTFFTGLNHCKPLLLESGHNLMSPWLNKTITQALEE